MHALARIAWGILVCFGVLRVYRVDVGYAKGLRGNAAFSVA